ncbi:MAG: MFS transporter [Betaproteobacteria bacterium]|nr:MFS transporter [Betaproteobacteria bacterium]
MNTTPHDDLRVRVTLMLIATLTVMSSATIAAALPQMARVFSATPNAELLTKLVLTTPALMIVVFAPLAGVFIDRVGRLRFLYANMVLYGFAGSAGYVLDDLHYILASRALLGVAVAGTMTTMNTLAGDYFSGEERARFAGMQSAAMSLGAAVFIGLGGLVAEIDWRLPFLIYLGGWLVLIPVLKYLKEPRRHAQHAPGAAISDPVPMGKLAVAYGLSFLAMVMFYMTVTQLPFLMRSLGIASSTLGGIVVAVSQLVSAFASTLYARLRGRSSFVRAYALGLLLMALGYGVIALIPHYAAVLAGAAISGFGVGIIFPNASLWVVTLAPPRMRGRLTGMMSASLNLGQFSSPLLLHPAVQSVGLDGAFGVAAVLACMLSGALLLAGRKLEQARG